VRIEIDPNDKDASWYSASDTLPLAMADTDGPETVGVYELVDTQRVEKVIQSARAAKSRK
jgi:hypothetical protein